MLSMCESETEDLTYEPHINVLKEELILELRSHQLRDTAVARIFSALASGQLVPDLAAGKILLPIFSLPELSDLYPR